MSRPLRFGSSHNQTLVLVYQALIGQPLIIGRPKNIFDSSMALNQRQDPAAYVASCRDVSMGLMHGIIKRIPCFLPIVIYVEDRRW